MNPFTPVRSRAVLLPLDNVDTDQIIPARYLKGTVKTGLGAHLFADLREREGFPLRPLSDEPARVLVAGANFGCGSSREHAPWALCDYGFRAVVARSFADIFRQNATKNGLLPVALDDASWQRVVSALRVDPTVVLTIDLETQRLGLPDGAAYTFAVEPFAKRCLLTGLDEIGYLLSFEPRIAEHEQRRG